MTTVSTPPARDTARTAPNGPRPAREASPDGAAEDAPAREEAEAAGGAPAPDDARPADAPQDGTLQDSAPQNGTPQNGTLQDGAPHDGTLQGDAPQNGTPQHGMSQDGVLRDGAPPRAAVEHARAMLAELGLACDTESTRRTPERFVAALADMTRGLRLDPDRHLGVRFPPESASQGVIAAVDVPFVALCEHHLLPFPGRATVAYLPAPGAPIVGLSKLARLLREYAARPQVQERLGEQTVAALDRILSPAGAACLIRSEHACMTLRGAEAHGAAMVTTHLTGVFDTDPVLRAEIHRLAPSALR
ncbi:GTP cyclohydrolase I [Nocardiopsis potens]|uniref:GTP cyclohydrolase I n=1 Tax=Nocardiopsis potens TaxID=1246458 RepID=UPI00034A6F45|nr:GTP cyclohydrolase I [Nocardiopsis potens]